METKTKRMLPNFQVRAELGNINEDSRTVEVVWTTGSKGLRTGWDGPFYEELSMDPKHVDMRRLNMGSAPVLASHDSSSLDAVIGVVERAWLDGDQGKAILRFSESDPVADRAYKKIKERVLRNVSVGYSILEMTDVSKKGDEIPTLRATLWQPHEISIVPIGFDMNATTRNNDNTNEVKFIEARSLTETEPVMDVPETLAAPEVVAPVVEAEPQAVDLEAVRAEGAAQERSRSESIVNAVRAANLDESLAREFISKGVSMADASKIIFKKLEEKLAATAVRTIVSAEITRDEKETVREGLENALTHRASPSVALTENGKRFAHMSMVEVAAQLIGGRPMGASDSAVATRAMTSGDLPNILANVAEKSMRSEFALQKPSFEPFTKRNTLRNYKTANRLTLGEFPSLAEVKEHGESTMGSVSESKETIQLKRYMKQIAFTKEMIVNDDLNALSDFSTKAARAASRLESALVYTDILAANSGVGPTMGDGNALFSTAHANYTSSGTAMSVASLAIGWAAVRKQTTIDGLEFADLMPKFLICGPDKEVLAMQLVSQNMLAATSATVNPFAGRLQVIVDPRITGNEWYLACDPSQIDTIEVARLEGEDGPIVSTSAGKTPGSSVITIEHSVGAAVLDHRGFYKNAGA